MRSRALTWLICGVLLAGCELLGLPSGNRSTEYVSISGGELFEIKVGQTAVLRDYGASIRFTELLGDSRCPLGVMCIWAGQVRVAFELRSGRTSYPFELVGFGPGPSGDPVVEREIADLHVKLLEVAPYPVHDPHPRRPTPAYTATLVVSAE